MNVRVHIERLVLDGVTLAPAQGPLLAAAVEGELTRLLGEGGIAPCLLPGGAMTHIRAGAADLAGVTEPAPLGERIARAVYGGIGR
jgi:hypothetical protein